MPDQDATFPELKQQCEPVSPESAGLSSASLDKIMPRFKAWMIVDLDDVARLRREFHFDDIVEGAQFALELARRAEQQAYYPDIRLTQAGVRVDWFTDQIKPLHKNDLIMAAKTDDIFSRWDLISGETSEIDESLQETFPASDPTGY